MKMNLRNIIAVAMGLASLGVLTGCDVNINSEPRSAATAQAISEAASGGTLGAIANDVSDFPSNKIVTADIQKDGSGRIVGLTFRDGDGNIITIPSSYSLADLSSEGATDLLLVNIPKSNGSILSLAIGNDADHYVYSLDGSGLAYFDFQPGVKSLLDSTLVTGVKTNGLSSRFSLALDSSSNLVAEEL